MKNMDVVCHCGKKVTIPQQENNGAVMQKTGYVLAFNISNGLESVWICPTCWEKCKPALSILKEVFGDQVGYIHFANLFRRPDVP